MASSGPPYMPDNIYMEQLNLKPMVIATAKGQYNGPHLFWIPPTQFSQEVTRLQITQPTQNGLIRSDFGYQAIQYVITGWGGNGGMTELLDSTKGMGYFSPYFGVQDQVYYLTYPWFRLLDIPVYIDYWKISADSNAMPNYATYEIHLSQIGTTDQPMQAYTQLAAVTGITTQPSPGGVPIILGAPASANQVGN